MSSPGESHLIILVKSQRAGERVMRSVRRFLERRLKLNEGDKIRWSDKAFQEKIQQTQEYPWDHQEHPGA
ncbi:MAG: hypothetical protein DRP28_07305 [Thermodesulfobacteriota bacterium]|nr:MAG: hypothetical protein DRP28_07305 [Thermodesulfobacteriota bacterium]